MTRLRPNITPLAAVVLPLCLGLPACFGDWVNARPRPKREAPTQDATPDNDSGTAATPTDPHADPCPAYLSTVAKHCTLVLQGHPQPTPCHAELVRLMAIFETSPQGPWDGSCAEHLAVAPTSTPNVPQVELGPHCREWAELIQSRCVRPLAKIPPSMRNCGAELLAFESTLGAITYGRAADHESQCEKAATQLANPTTPKP